MSAVVFGTSPICW